MTIVQDLSSSRTVVIQTPVPPAASATRVPRSADEVITPGAPYYDHEIVQNTAAAVWGDYALTADLECEFSSLTPQFATVTPNGYVTFVSAGAAQILVKSGTYSRLLTLSMTTSGGSTIKRISDYVNGSRSDILRNGIFSRLTEGSQLEYYSTVDHAAGIYVRNTQCWAADLNLSATAVATDLWGAQFNRANRGTLITDQHVVGAAHWNVYYPYVQKGAGYVPGSKLRWVDATGNVYTRVVIGVARGVGDLVVATLDQPLPPQIRVMPIVGDWIMQGLEYAPDSARYFIGGLAFHLQQQYKCGVVVLGSFDPVGRIESFAPDLTVNGTAMENVILHGGCQEGSVVSNRPLFMNSKSSFMVSAIGGDSGSPVMVVLPDGSTALLWTWLSSTSGTPVWNGNGAVLQAMIGAADADAIGRGALGSPTGKSLTAADDPL